MQTKNVLIAAAIVAFAAGLMPFAQRWWDGRKFEQAALAAQAARAVQISALAREQSLLASANKNNIMKQLLQLQSTGQHSAVMHEAAKYRLADDPDIQNVYRISANEISNTQLLQRFRDLIATQCTGIQAQQTATVTMAVLFAADAPVSTSQWKYERLDSAHVLPLIRKRFVELMNAASDSKSSSDVSSPLARARAVHALRLQPLVATSLLNQAAEAAELVCAWRVRGTGAKAAHSFDLTLWYAPSANERTLEYDVLALTLK